MSGAPPKQPPPIADDVIVDLDASTELVEITDIEEVQSSPGAPSTEAPLPMLEDLVDLPSAPPKRNDDISLELDDLPAPSQAKPPAPRSRSATVSLDDLPASIDLSTPGPALATSSVPSLMDDLPMEAPLLESPRTDALFDVQPSPDLATLDLDVDAAPPRPPTPGLSGGAQALSDHPLSAAPGAAASPKSRKKVMRTLGIVGGCVAVLGGATALAVTFWPPAAAMLDPVLALFRPPPPPPPPTPVVIKVAEAPPKPPPPPPPKPVIVELNQSNVDRLGYADLLASAAAMGPHPSDSDKFGIVLWARYRLATSFEDSTAKGQLLSLINDRFDPTSGPLGAAAQAGAMLSFGKPPQVKHAFDHVRGPAFKTPQAQYLLAWNMAKKHAPKALMFAEKALGDAPGMIDAQLLRGEILLGKKEHSEATRLLIEISKAGDPGVVARAAELLRRANELTAMDEVLSAIKDPQVVQLAAPAHRSALYAFLVRRNVRAGDLLEALHMATLRVSDSPDNANAVIEAARLTDAEGNGEAKKVLIDARANMADPEARAHVLAEQVRVAIGKTDNESVQDALKQLVALPPHAARGWMKMAEAAVAERDKQPVAAKEAYVEAAQTAPTFEEPRLALLLSDDSSPEVRLASLSKMAHKSDLPAIHYQLALLLEAKHEYAEAARELEQLTWLDPTVADPIVLLLHWMDLLDRAGEALRAETLAEALSTARPKDDRPPQQIIQMALRGKRFDTAVKWYKTLLTRHPAHRAYTTALANVYVDAGKAGDAQQLLDAQAKADPQGIDDEFLYSQARAWATADVVKARGFLMESIKQHPQAKTYLLLADLEESRGKLDETMQAYRDAVNIDPSLVSVRLKLTHNLITKNFTKEAIDELQKVLQLNPQQSEAAEMLGDIEREQGQYKDALQAYEQALQGHDKSPVLMKIAKLQLHELSQVQQAIKTLRRIAKVDPHNAETFYLLGYALRDVGKPGEARGALQNYLRLAPQGEFAADVRQDIPDIH